MGQIIDGTVMRISIGGANITKATNCSFTLNRETRTRSHKDQTGGFTSVDYGKGSWEASGEGLYAEAESYDTLWNAMIAKTKVALEMSTDVDGTKKITGDGVVTSLELNAPDSEDTTFSYSITGDGEPVRAEI